MKALILALLLAGPASAEIVTGPPLKTVLGTNVRVAPIEVRSNVPAKAVAAYRLRNGEIARIECETPCVLGIPENAAFGLNVLKPGWKLAEAPPIGWVSTAFKGPDLPSPYVVRLEPVQ